MSDTLTMAPVRTRTAARPSVRLGRTAIAARPVLTGAAVATATLGVYAATLAPDLYSLDSPELAAAAHRLGIAHAPGYPLYTLVGWLFSHAFPIGNVAFRLNLLSALFAVAAVVLTYGVALRLTSRPLLAAAGALMLGFSYYFWLDSLAAEVYSLDAALFAGMLLAALAWRTRPGIGRAAAVGLLLGLALATRTTALLYLPALLAFAWTAGERSPRTYAAAAVAAATGLAFYLYLPLRSATGVDVGPGDYALDGSLRVWDLASFDGFWRHVSASAFRGDAFAYGPAGMVKEAGVFSGMLAGAFLGVGVPLGIAGIVRLWRKDRGALLLFAGTAAPLAVFFINYGTLDKEFMFLPVYAVWALFVVAGLDWLVEAATVDMTPVRRGGFAAAALVLPAVALVVNWPLVSLRDERSVRAESEAFLAQVPAGSIVYGPFLDIAPFQYLQEVEGQRPDIRLVNSWTVDDGFLLALARANVGTTPVFLTRDEPALHGEFQVATVGDDRYEVRPAEGAR